MLSVKLCFNTYQATMRPKYGQRLLMAHLDFKMDSTNGGISIRKNIWVRTGFRYNIRVNLKRPYSHPEHSRALWRRGPNHPAEA